MTSTGSQDMSRAPHLLLYDGECGLCNRIVQFVLHRDRSGLFHFASLQSAAAARVTEGLGARPDDQDTFVVVVGYRTAHPAMLIKARAAIFTLTTMGGPWTAAGVLRLLPASLLDRGYELVARNRRRLFPLNEHCLVPRQEYRARFLDSTCSTASDHEVTS